MAEPFSVFAANCPFHWLEWSSIYIYSRKLKRFFFKTSRYSVLAWIFSGFYFAKAGVSSIYYFHVPYSFLHLYPSRVYVTIEPSSQRTDQSSSWFEADRRGRAGFEFSSWLAWIFSDNVWQVHKFKSAMTILFTDIVSTTRHRVKQQTAGNFTARTTAFFGFFWNWIECAKGLNWEL